VDSHIIVPILFLAVWAGLAWAALWYIEHAPEPWQSKGPIGHIINVVADEDGVTITAVLNERGVQIAIDHLLGASIGVGVGQ
jgi:hypothetical protein